MCLFFWIRFWLLLLFLLFFFSAGYSTHLRMCMCVGYHHREHSRCCCHFATVGGWCTMLVMIVCVFVCVERVFISLCLRVRVCVWVRIGYASARAYLYVYICVWVFGWWLIIPSDTMRALCLSLSLVVCMYRCVLFPFLDFMAKFRVSMFVKVLFYVYLSVRHYFRGAFVAFYHCQAASIVGYQKHTASQLYRCSLSVQVSAREIHTHSLCEYVCVCLSLVESACHLLNISHFCHFSIWHTIRTGVYSIPTEWEWEI